MLLRSVLAAVLGALVMTGAATAARTSPGATGNDVSYPQCNQPLPKGQNFGVVGMNGGTATKPNPCFSEQLKWAGGSAQLYLNTGNPGPGASWPKNNIDPAGNLPDNPYGYCDGSNSVACAWQYGWNRAVEDDLRLVVTALGVGQPAGVADYHWWLDVETANSWQDGSDAAPASNRAVLEGMVAYLTSLGAKLGTGGTLGVYSTARQWVMIAGAVPASSSLYKLNSWLPGAETIGEAKRNCLSPALVPGGWVTITQYTSRVFDYDYSCI